MPGSDSAGQTKQTRPRRAKAAHGERSNERAASAKGSRSPGSSADRAVGAGDGEGGRVHELDFSRPARFNSELRQRIVAALVPFCESLGSRLAAELKSGVELTLDGLAEHTWASARAQLPADALAVAIDQDADGGSLLMSLELGLVLGALECLLGGSVDGTPAERHLSDVDWALARGLTDAAVAELAPAWAQLGGAELERGALDIEGDAGVAGPAAEPTLLITIAVRIDSLSGSLALLVPWSAARLLAERLGGAEEQPQSPEQGAANLRAGLAAAQVLLRAEVGSVQMPVERMLELAPGGVLALGQRSQEGVLLFAEGVSVGRGRPGRSGVRRAIKLESTGEPPVRAATYATLGRAELARARAEAELGVLPCGERAILHTIFVRIWAELGRTHLPLGHTLELRPGTVVELDQAADAPVELFANGLCFARGKLVVTAEGEWGVLIDELT